MCAMGSHGSREVSREETDLITILKRAVRQLWEEAGQEFHKKNPTWHCIIGWSFGNYLTHETEHFIYFCLVQGRGTGEAGWPA